MNVRNPVESPLHERAQVLPGYPLDERRIPIDSSLQEVIIRRCGTLVLPLNSHLPTHFSLRVWPQRFARSVCLVTCRDICKGQGVKVVNHCYMKEEFQWNPLYMIKEVRNLGSATHFPLRVAEIRKVCLVTCRGKGQGVKVVNDSPLHERRIPMESPLHDRVQVLPTRYSKVRNPVDSSLQEVIIRRCGTLVLLRSVVIRLSWKLIKLKCKKE